MAAASLDTVAAEVRMGLGASLLLSIGSALVCGACFPPTSLRLLAWVALVPFLAVLRRSSFGRCIALAWLWWLAMSQVVAEWLPTLPCFAPFEHTPFSSGPP